MAEFCSFSSPLSDLTVREKKDDEAVLTALRAHPVFSCFEVDVHLGRTLARLTEQTRFVVDKTINRRNFIGHSEVVRTARIKYPKSQPGYPWVRVEVLDEPAGEEGHDG